MDLSQMPVELEAGLRIYAIGDIHGRFDLLRRLHAKIADDLAMARVGQSIEIFLGDYIDRGPRSADVVEWLTAEVPAADRRICLMGNHEDLLLRALTSLDEMPAWLSNGADTTLLSYNVIPPTWLDARRMERTRAEFLSALPPTHDAFLRALPRMVEFSPYLFVHAGLRPGVPIAEQDPDDLLWIRGPFLDSDADFGRIVVHGHTPVERPDFRPNRINIDTGAVFSDRLTCLVLEGRTARVIQAEGS